MNKLLFDHVPKTGGTSLVTLLEKIVGQNHIISVLGENARLACERLKDATVIAGHMSFYPGEILDPDRYSLTLLRHPVDRVLSAYGFFRNNPNALITKSVHLASQMDFEAYLNCEESVVRDEVSNAQTNHYCYLGYDRSDNYSDDQKLSAAKSALEKFDLVGIIDQYEDFVDILCFEQKWPPVLDIPHDNITVRRQEVSDISAHLQTRLRALNELDIELYEHARKLFHSHRRRIMLACIEQRSAGGNSVAATPTATPKTDSLPSVQYASLSNRDVDFGDHGAEIVSTNLLGDLIASPQILSGELFVCRVIFKANEDISDLTVGIHIRDEQGLLVFGTNSRFHGTKLSVTKGAEYFVDFAARCDLGIGKYTVGAGLHPGTSHLQRCFHWREKVVGFEVIGQLGYHSEGAFKLHPTLDYGSFDPTKGMLIAEQAVEGSSGFQLLAHHTPPLSEFSAVIRALNAEPITVAAGQIFEIEIEVNNTSRCNWPSIGLRAVCISYHWLDSTGNMLVYDGKRTPLLRDVPPAATIRTWASVIAPDQTGHARLQLTLVQEHVGWFDEKGCSPAEVGVVVRTGPN